MLSAIMASAAPVKRPRKGLWRRAANERAWFMAVRASWPISCCRGGMAHSEVLCCPTCDLTQRVDSPARGERAECPRCGATVRDAPHGSLQLTAALALAALILYIPANIYPILRMHFYGAYSESTVWDGVVSLAQSGQYL